jgi:hypothetical protein
MHWVLDIVEGSGIYDPWTYDANPELAPKPVEAGQDFWPVGGK